MRKKYFLNFFLVIMSLALSSCVSQEQFCKAVRYVDGYDNGDEVCASGVVGASRSIRLEETEACRLHSVRKVVIRHGKIYALNENMMKTSIYIYDMKGKFLGKIGEMGAAQNEYLYIDTFCFDDKGRLYLFDGNKRKIMIYNAEGEFLDRKNYLRDHMVADIEYVGEDSLLVCNGFDNNVPIYEIYDIAKDCKTALTNTVIKPKDGVIGAKRHPVSIYKDKIRYMIPFENVIYDMNNSEDFCVQTSEKIFSREEICSEYYEEMADKTWKGYFPGFDGVYETDKYVIVPVRFSVLFIDKESNKLFRHRWEENHTYILWQLCASYGNTIVSLYDPDYLDHLKRMDCKQFLTSICGRNYTESDLNSHYLVFHELKK